MNYLDQHLPIPYIISGKEKKVYVLFCTKTNSILDGRQYSTIGAARSAATKRYTMWNLKRSNDIIIIEYQLYDIQHHPLVE